MGTAGAGLTYLLISTWIYQVLADSVDSMVCVPYGCLNCNVSNTENCQMCSNVTEANSTNCTDSPKSCIRGVSVQLNASSFKVNEGSTLTVDCIHNLTEDLITGFYWLQNDEVIKEMNTSRLTRKFQRLTKLACVVLSHCGNFSSSSQDITVNDGTGVILAICGISAVVVIILFAVAMKIIIKRNEARNEARKRQRQARMQNINSPNTITGYW